MNRRNDRVAVQLAASIILNETLFVYKVFSLDGINFTAYLRPTKTSPISSSPPCVITLEKLKDKWRCRCNNEYISAELVISIEHYLSNH